MRKLSDGSNSTLGRWMELANAVFGEDSKQSKFLQKKIDESPNGVNEEVIADESQLLYVLVNL